jgi:signal transduction histidine kinase
MCKKIVEYHGGRIWIDTAHTGGARICFTLPRTAPDQPAAASEPALEGTPA